MASVRINMRVPGDLWAAVSAYATERGESNTAVVVAALRSFLGDAKGGVPDLPAAVARESEQAERSVPAPAKPDPRAPADDWHTWAMERQQKLNAAKYGRNR